MNPWLVISYKKFKWKFALEKTTMVNYNVALSSHTRHQLSIFYTCISLKSDGVTDDQSTNHSSKYFHILSTMITDAELPTDSILSISHWIFQLNRRIEFFKTHKIRNRYTGRMKWNRIFQCLFISFQIYFHTIDNATYFFFGFSCAKTVFHPTI